jgi:hypothetical protein
MRSHSVMDIEVKISIQHNLVRSGKDCWIHRGLNLEKLSGYGETSSGKETY